METWRKTLAQFRDLFNGMAPSQRMTLVAVPLMVVTALALVMYMGRGPAEEHLNAGKAFSADELKHAEEALRQAGLPQYRVEGQKILVPRSEVVRYQAALVEKGVRSDFGADMDKVYENGFFMGDQERRDKAELAKSKTLSKIIRAIPDVEDANVIWERPRQKPFNGDSKATCTVSVRMRAGRELTAALARSLRLAVSGAVSGLAPANVTVLDVTTGRAVRDEADDDPFNSQFIDQVKKFTTLHQRNIAEALAYIPNVIVSVNVDLENLKTSWEREQKYDAKAFPLKSVEESNSTRSDEKRPSSEPGMAANTPRNLRQQVPAENVRTTDKTTVSNENVPISTKVTDRTLIGMLPKSVQVTVSIPEDYYRLVALSQGEPGTDKQALQGRIDQIRSKTVKEVADKVAKLIPPAGAAADSVNVSSYVRLDQNNQPAESPLVARLNEGLAQWGGPLALGLFALWTLWMLNRSLKKLPQEPPAMPAGKGSAAVDVDEDEEQAPREVTKRDQLQTLVRDNPEMAAAVIGRWIAPPK